MNCISNAVAASVFLIVAGFSSAIVAAESEAPAASPSPDAAGGENRTGPKADGLHIPTMLNAYRPIRGTKEGGVRPRLFATALVVMDAEVLTNAWEYPAKGGPTYYGERRIAIVQSILGWSMLPLRSGLDVKQKDVIEIVIPSANDFRDLNNVAKVRSDLDDLKYNGVYSIQSVLRNCVSNMILKKKDKTISCEGKVMPPVINAKQFSEDTLRRLTPPKKLKKT